MAARSSSLHLYTVGAILMWQGIQTIKWEWSGYLDHDGCGQVIQATMWVWPGYSGHCVGVARLFKGNTWVYPDSMPWYGCGHGTQPM